MSTIDENPNIQTIYLSDNKPFRVKRLGLFELDELMPQPIGKFTYKMELFGKEYDVEFDLDAWDEPPQKPDKPESEIKEGSREWDQLTDYKLYQAALFHRDYGEKVVVNYAERVRAYIIKNCAIDSFKRIVTAEDWYRVYEAALVPQLTMELIAETLSKTYQAEFEGRGLLEALADGKKSRGSYNQIKLWENKLMVSLQMDETQYSLLPLKERARKVCAMFLEDIMGYLEFEANKKEDG